MSLGIKQLTNDPWTDITSKYPVKSKHKGKIRNFTNFGVFVELEEGIDGMVHVTDMSWTRKINHPGEVMNKGDQVDAIVLDVDTSQQRISLGLKQLTDDPWAEIEHHFKIGDIVEGKVAKVASYGAFVELPNDIDGLVHISQVSEDRVEKIGEVINAGDSVKARVIKIDKGERRVGLSIKAANYDEEQLAAETAAYEAQTTDNLTSLGDLLDEATRDGDD